MKKRSLQVKLGLLITCSIILSQAYSQTRFTGSIVDHSSDKLLSGISIEAFDKDGNPFGLATTTQANGEYSISAITTDINQQMYDETIETTVNNGVLKVTISSKLADKQLRIYTLNGALLGTQTLHTQGGGKKYCEYNVSGLNQKLLIISSGGIKKKVLINKHVSEKTKLLPLIKSQVAINDSVTFVINDASGKYDSKVVVVKDFTSGSSNNINFRLFLKNIYARPMHLMCINTGGWTLSAPSDRERLLAEIASMPVRPTMACQVVLNNKNPGKNAQFISDLKKLIPNLFFGVGAGWHANDGLGFDLNNQTDWDDLTERARRFVDYTDCISIEGFNATATNSGDDKMIEWLDTLVAMGYKHIMANPWKKAKSGKPWPHVEATFENTLKSTVTPPNEPWQPRIWQYKTILRNSPDLKIVIMYENRGAHLELSAMTAQEAQDAMANTIKWQINQAQETPPLNMYWAPPWTRNYDPLTHGTWDWIKQAYSDLNDD